MAAREGTERARPAPASGWEAWHVDTGSCRCASAVGARLWKRCSCQSNAKSSRCAQQERKGVNELMRTRAHGHAGRRAAAPNCHPHILCRPCARLTRTHRLAGFRGGLLSPHDGPTALVDSPSSCSPTPAAWPLHPPTVTTNHSIRSRRRHLAIHPRRSKHLQHHALVTAHRACSAHSRAAPQQPLFHHAVVRRH